ncbi:MAG: YjbQ family protein [Rhodospirillales bacterium]|nr:YjbQ family protein [Rhodospirillales bacterium]
MKQVQDLLSFETSAQGLTEITGDIALWVAAQDIDAGMLTVFIRHTSASLIIQENADDDVMRDIEAFFKKMVPEGPGLYRHKTEGFDDMPAHIKGALTQSSLSIPVTGAKLALGTWQGIFLFEHRTSPKRREIALHLIGV